MKTATSIRPVSESERGSWDKVVAHPLQSWAWGEFRHAMGVDVVRLGVYERQKLTRGWQLTFHRIPYSGFTVGYFPKGPAITGDMLKTLREVGRQKNAIFIQLEPDVTSDEPMEVNKKYSVRMASRALFTKYTFVLDLTKSEEELISAMHPKTRYNIRVAQKHGVAVTENNADSAFAEYLKLSRQTTQRQGFYAHNDTYHKAMWKTLKKDGIARLFTAVYKDTIIAAWVVFVWKNTVYYPYGASSRDHREVMAPNLMLWEIVAWAKRQGLFYFDLWGSLGANPDPGDPWYGFHRFKEGYRPQLVEFVGSFDLIIHPVWYALFTLADRIRWTLLRIRRGR